MHGLRQDPPHEHVWKGRSMWNMFATVVTNKTSLLSRPTAMQMRRGPLPLCPPSTLPRLPLPCCPIIPLMGIQPVPLGQLLAPSSPPTSPETAPGVTSAIALLGRRGRHTNSSCSAMHGPGSYGTPTRPPDLTGLRYHLFGQWNAATKTLDTCSFC